MGVYIDMEMPKSCPCELVGIGYDMYCSFVCGIPYRLVEYYECCQNGTRPEWCPLKSVPPHGRLIDADALIAAHEQVCSRSMKFNLDLAPTIIPAEEGE